MTLAASTRLATQLRSIEDELATSVNRSSPQALDSVASAMTALRTSLAQVKDAIDEEEDGRVRQTIILELEQAAMCGRRASADSGSDRGQYITNMIAHVHAAYTVLAIA